MNEYLTFRKMITPVIIQVIFWIGIACIVVGALMTMASSVVTGLLILLFGPIALRVYCEILIVLFKIHANVETIARSKGG